MEIKKVRNRWSEQRLYEEAAKYQTKSEFKKANPSAYNAASRKRLLPAICAHMNTSGYINWTPETIRAEAVQYLTKVAFKRHSPRAYDAAVYKGILDEVCSHMPQNRVYWNTETIQVEANKFRTRREFELGSRAAYMAAQRRGILDEVCRNMEPGAFRWDPESARQEALKYSIRDDFKRYSGGAHGYAVDAGILDDICRHMKRGYTATDNDAVYIWKAIGEYFNGKPVYKIGITSHRLNDRRISQGAAAMGLEYELLILEKVKGKASYIECKLLSMGDDPKYIGSGATEFRALDSNELIQAMDLIKSHSLDAQK